jgi:HEAT repeat protein
MGLFGPNVNRLIKDLTNQTDVKIRCHAADLLGELKDPRAVEPLITALKDRNVNVFLAATQALGRIGEQSDDAALRERIIESLISSLKNRFSFPFPFAAGEALEKIGDVRAIDPLITLLKDDDVIVRSKAARVLGKIGNTQVIEPLFAALKDKDDYVRATAAEALGEIGDASAVEPLLIIACMDSSGSASEAASKALKKIGWQPAKDKVSAAYWVSRRNWKECVNIGAPAVEPLITALKDGDMDVRKAAANALDGIIGWQPGKDDEVHVAYLIAKQNWKECARVGTPAVEQLLATLKVDDFFVRYEAALTLDRVGWKPGKDETGLAYWIANRNWKECINIGAPAVEPLIATLKYDGGEKGAVAEALGEIGDARAVKPLITVLDDTKSSPNARRGAAKALVNLYREGHLDEKYKANILTYRKKIIMRHEDSLEGCFGESLHYDLAAIDFPL